MCLQHLLLRDNLFQHIWRGDMGVFLTTQLSLLSVAPQLCKTPMWVNIYICELLGSCVLDIQWQQICITRTARRFFIHKKLGDKTRKISKNPRVFPKIWTFLHHLSRYISYWKRWQDSQHGAMLVTTPFSWLNFTEVVRNHRLRRAKPLAWYPSPGGGCDVTHITRLYTWNQNI